MSKSTFETQVGGIDGVDRDEKGKGRENYATIFYHYLVFIDGMAVNEDGNRR
jgi:hypothetical protein